jgi:hypothetical protein
MLPPSPQNYQPRYHSHHTSLGSTLPQSLGRGLPPPQHRPTSSMSISSMLGSDSDHPSRDQVSSTANNGTPNNFAAKPVGSGLEMSSPHHSVRPSPGKAYESGPQTPDRMGISNLLGPRPYRSGSGSIMQSSRPSEDTLRVVSGNPFPTFEDNAPQSSGHGPARYGPESPQHVRRSSIAGILQRPNSQPEPQAHGYAPGPRLQPVNYPQPAQPTWLEQSKTPASTNPNATPPHSQSIGRTPETSRGPHNGHLNPSTTTNTQYDICPPALSPPVQHQSSAPRDHEYQPRPAAWERPSSNPRSPDIARQKAASGQYRPFNNGPANGQIININSAPHENQQPTSAPMSQQGSGQSHRERLALGERLDKNRSRLFSPFAAPQFTHQHAGSSLAVSEEPSRKGSDELSHHRALLGLAAEGKRTGRYSPLPQAVQGAQVQSLGPELGIKSEHGRIFSGIGSGVGNAGTSPAQAPMGLPASPFKRDDGTTRLLNEENLMRMSRSSPGFGKRGRKVKEEDGKAASESDGTGRVGKKARNSR